ncbi:hypothetical protein QJS10_CPA07g00694 [Acorus calamus]|uniref:Uncharacterized protein n=1 Tax=Acorus calamus TaxID=4465 RepID=A0AAV9EGR4_ACOCL|nr:hypothetical protein QJS10_CPA07g00694 [Acorus calamus]
MEDLAPPDPQQDSLAPPNHPLFCEQISLTLEYRHPRRAPPSNNNRRQMVKVRLPKAKRKFMDCDEEDLKEMDSHWGLSLVGYVIGKRPYYKPFVDFLHRLWKPKGPWRS